MTCRNFSFLPVLFIFLTSVSLVAVAGPGPTSFDCEHANALAAGVNDAGVIVGAFTDASNLDLNTVRGFVRDKQGNCSPLDYPGAAATIPAAINDPGQIVGTYYDDSGQHAFLYEKGHFQNIDYPGACQTSVSGINNRGDIVGFYDLLTQSGCERDYAYVRFSDGIVKTLSPPPGATDSYQANGINARGQIVGFFLDTNTQDEHGYASDTTNGTFASFDPPGSLATKPQSINAQGEIVGTYFSHHELQPIGDCNSFFRDKDGSIKTFSYPGAQYTCSFGIDASGSIVGGWFNGIRWQAFIADKTALMP